MLDHLNIFKVIKKKFKTNFLEPVASSDTSSFAKIAGPVLFLLNDLEC